MHITEIKLGTPNWDELRSWINQGYENIGALLFVIIDLLPVTTTISREGNFKLLISDQSNRNLFDKYLPPINDLNYLRRWVRVE